MSTYVKMPRLGLTMTTGVLIRWLKAEGEKVEKGEPIAEIESDKSVVTYESPESGHLLKTLLSEGDSCEIYSPIAVLGEPGEEIPTDVTEEEKEEPVTVLKEDTGGSSPEPAAKNQPTGNGDRVFISPLARKTAKDNGIDFTKIPFPQDKKRIEKKDVLRYIEETKIKATPLAAKIASEKNINLASIGKAPGERIFSSDVTGYQEPLSKTGNTIPVAGMRKVIARRMKQSIDTAAHVALTTEVDMSNAIDFKSRIGSSVEQKYGVKVSLNHIVIKCVAAALREHPRINSVFTEETITEMPYINIGVAVALEEGLVVPVIKDADALSIGEIAEKSKVLTEKARQGRLMPDEYNEGTFTVSNLGMYDITQFTSIINQPESAILSVGKVVERVVPLNGQIVVRPIMNLTINFDHRPIDGSAAAIFLKRVKEILEEPYELLI